MTDLPQGTVTLTIEGGFAAVPGLARPRQSDLATWAEADRREFARLLELVTAEGRQPLKQRPRPDANTYLVALTGPAGERKVTLSEPFASRDAGRLVEIVASHVK